MDDRDRRFVIVVADVAPRIFGYRRIVLPEQRSNILELAALDIEHRRAFGKRFELVIDRHALAPLGAAVVIVCREGLQVGLEDFLLDPPVKPDQLRLVLIHQLAGARQPIIQVIHARARL